MTTQGSGPRQEAAAAKPSITKSRVLPGDDKESGVAGTAMKRVTAALAAKGCRPRGSSAHCPSHHDRKPSLSINAGTVVAGVVLTCQAGCPTDVVVAALGLTMSDLFDHRPDCEYDVIAEYPYTDEAGEILFIKERREPKDFRCKLPNGCYALGDTRRVLYRLPEVVMAVRAGETVYVVEGEKDADALAARGLAATCNFDGASALGQTTKWRPEYGEVLRGAHVVVIADKDPAGRAHAAAIVADLTAHAASVLVFEAAVGNDVSDHLAAGKNITDLVPAVLPLAGAGSGKASSPGRQVTLTPASSIPVRPVHWLWEDRLPVGSMSLLAGREGIGKSTIAYTLAADITCGRLAGQHLGQPKAVLVAATEDSWAHTIVPRLMAADADLDLVFRVDVQTSEDGDSRLSLPSDVNAVEQALWETDAALILLDPLMSRLDGKLDTHRDAEVRQALEPLTALADRAGVAVLGIIHLNKGTGDPLTRIMASRAFPAVARAVLFVMTDPQDDEIRLMGQEKNNLGRTDLPTLRFTLESALVAQTTEGPVTTSRAVWLGVSTSSITEALEASEGRAQVQTTVGKAAAWLKMYLEGGLSISLPPRG